MGGQQIRLFLVDGTPGGLTTAEITNWTGRLVSAARSDLSQLLVREESSRPGVYVLLGDDPTAVEGVRCYIGEADAVASRLREHHGPRGKDWWTRVVIITSKDDNLTKGHTRYVESRLVHIALQASRCTVDNSTAPQPPPLPEADCSDMEFFIDKLHIALPVLGVNVLRGRASADQATASPAETNVSPVFEMRVARTSIRATAQQVDGEFTVLQGSRIAAGVRDLPAYASFKQLHERLVTNGSVRPDGDTAVLTRDVVFTSPSTAGAVVTGRSCNGRIEWKTPQGTTFGQWEERGLT